MFKNFYLEKIPKGPVPQHFKEGVVICVFPNIIKIVMLPTGTDAFLGVDGTFEFTHVTARINSALEYWLELKGERGGREEGRDGGKGGKERRRGGRERGKESGGDGRSQVVPCTLNCEEWGGVRLCLVN